MPRASQAFGAGTSRQGKSAMTPGRRRDLNGRGAAMPRRHYICGRKPGAMAAMTTKALGTGMSRRWSTPNPGPRHDSHLSCGGDAAETATPRLRANAGRYGREDRDKGDEKYLVAGEWRHERREHCFWLQMGQACDAGRRPGRCEHGSKASTTRVASTCRCVNSHAFCDGERL